MKKLVRVLLIICLLTGVLLSFLSPAYADDNITFNVNFNTQTAGPKGGTIRITVSLFNNTAKEIDWIDFRVNTADPFLEHWTGYDGVPPYCHRSNSIDVFFAPEDLDKDKFLQLEINYDSDANPDDVKMHKFSISGLDEVISVAATSDPSGGQFIVGDSVFTTHRLTNNSDYRAEDIVIQCLMINESGERIADSGPANMEGLDGGLSVGVPIGAEFSADDKDYVEASYALAYTYLGERYAITDTTIFMAVMHPDFTAELSPAVHSIAPSAESHINLRLRNTGNVGFGSFGIESHLGAHMADAGSLGAGESMDVTIPIVYTETGDFELGCRITGDFGYGEHEEESNRITVTCELPETEGPGEESTPEVSAAAPNPTQTNPPTQQPERTEAHNTSEPDQTIAAYADSDNKSATAYIIIGVLALLILIAAIILTVIDSKKNGNGKNKKRDSSL